MDISNKKYDEMVKKASPPSPVLKNCLWAFGVGGAICCFGEVLFKLYGMFGMDTVETRTMVSVTLIVIAAILTGIGIFDKIAKHAGAGTVVPITGFANSVVAPALEHKSEGFVMGTGANIFKVSGPVIAYGILASTAFGLVYYIVQKVMT
jgi:stage V sporulation protein AC